MRNGKAEPTAGIRAKAAGNRKGSFTSYMKGNWQLYVMILPAVIYFLVFNYFPLYGIQIAFKDDKAVWGIAGSPWVGFKQFDTFFHAYYFKRLIVNTLVLNVENLAFSFPIPIIMAIMLNQIHNGTLRQMIQTSIYVPYFISTVVLAGMLYIFLSPTSGILNFIREAMGLKAVDYMSSARAFRPIYIISGIWQSAGYNTRRTLCLKSDHHCRTHKKMPDRFRMLFEHLYRIPPVQLPGDVHMDSIINRHVAHLVGRIKNSRRTDEQNKCTDQNRQEILAFFLLLFIHFTVPF